MDVSGQHNAPAALPHEIHPISIKEFAQWVPETVWALRKLQKPRTVQSVAYHYTDCATPAPTCILLVRNSGHCPSSGNKDSIQNLSHNYDHMPPPKSL